MRVLFVAPYIPSPVRVRPYQWIRALARHGHQVHLVALQPPEDRWVEGVPVADCCEQVSVFPLGRARTLANGLLSLPRDLPLQAAYSHHPAAERFVAGQAGQYDVVHVEHLRGALLARNVRHTPCVFDAVDSISALFAQTATQAPGWKQRMMARIDLARTRRFEARLPRLFERTVVSSARDADALVRLGGPDAVNQIVTIPNGVDLEYFHPSEPTEAAAGPTIVFTGKMSYHANSAAVLRLAGQIMPLVWKAVPTARLVIAGKNPPATIRNLSADPRVQVTGFVEDLRPFFWQASALVAPLAYGTGIQNKVLEAMACGIPVVTSPVGCEGLPRLVAGRDVLVGGDDGEVAAHTVALLRSSQLRESLGAAGRQYVQTHHDWGDQARDLIDVYEAARAGWARQSQRNAITQKTL